MSRHRKYIFSTNLTGIQIKHAQLTIQFNINQVNKSMGWHFMQFHMQRHFYYRQASLNDRVLANTHPPLGYLLNHKTAVNENYII
jgi:hypothetical protein